MKAGELILIVAVLSAIGYLVYRAKSQPAPASTLWNPLSGLDPLVIGANAANFVDNLFSDYEFAGEGTDSVTIPTM